MTEAAAATTKMARYAKGVRGTLPAPKKTSAELAAIRARVRGMTQLDAVTLMRAEHKLTLDQCGQVLGVSENRIARILKPQRRPAGTVGVRCIACRWRGERLITSHEDCPQCGADHELVVPSAQLKWVQVPVPVDALAALGSDYEGALCKLVASHVVRLLRDGKRRRKT